MTVYVLDASVAVSAVRPSEASHGRSRACVARVLSGADTIVVPAIFDVEVTSALVRSGASASASRGYVESDLAARQVVTIGPRAARSMSEIAAATRLRAADAAYVWVAMRRGIPLVTLDLEIGQKAAGFCRVQVP